jgi:asparagine synthase (glutamine-hydrolysing)
VKRNELCGIVLEGRGSCAAARVECCHGPLQGPLRQYELKSSNAGSYSSLFLGELQCGEGHPFRHVIEDDDCMLTIVGDLRLGVGPAGETAALERLVRSIHKEGLESTLQSMRGSYAGVFTDKRRGEVCIFSDWFATHPVYYAFWQQEKLFLFASRLDVLGDVCMRLGRPLSVNADAVRCLLGLGYIVEDWTLLNEVRHLMPCSVVRCSSSLSGLTSTRYHRWREKPTFAGSRVECVDRFDTLIRSAVSSEWQVDRLLGKASYAFLSGGLDSRLNVMIAHDMGLTGPSLLTITFGTSSGSDARVAQEISSSIGAEHLFYSLNRGLYLLRIFADSVVANGGLNAFQGSAHKLAAMSMLDHRPYGLAHGGQIGGDIWGRDIRRGLDLRRELTMAGLLDAGGPLGKVQGLDSLIQQYPDEDTYEQYIFDQQLSNHDLNGHRSLLGMTEEGSPFCDPDLVDFCLSLPRSWRAGDNVRIWWMNSKARMLTEWAWEHAGVRPTSVPLVRVGVQVTRYESYFRRKLGLPVNHMNPFWEWFHNEHELGDSLRHLVLELSPLIDDSELRSDVLRAALPSARYETLCYAATAVAGIDLLTHPQDVDGCKRRWTLLLQSGSAESGLEVDAT